jgi:hypothetical protein
VFVPEDCELPCGVCADRARHDAHEHERCHHDQQHGDPHVEHAQPRGRRQVEVKADAGGQEADQIQPDDPPKRGERVAGLRRDRQQVVHAEPGRDHKRNQNRYPHEPGVLDPGVGSGGNTADQRAAVLDQRHRLARAEQAEYAHGHHGGNQHLHRGNAEVAEPGVQTEREPLPALREERADVAHRGREVAAADAAQECQKLKYPERRVRILQRHARAERGNHEHRARQEDRVAPAREADHERRGDAQRRAGQPRDRSQREQLRRRERESQVDHLYRDDSPHQPHGKTA